jgi:FkbM family methyltransferase
MKHVEALRGFLRQARSHPVGVRQPVWTMARMAAWQLRSRLLPGPHEQGWIEDSRLVLESGMAGATGNLYFGLHEFADMAFLLHFLRADDDFLDIGANVGTYTILAAKLCGARVAAFEPDPATAARHERNLAANGIVDRVTLHRSALGAEAGEIGFTSGLDAMNHVTIDPGEIGQTVPVWRLDDLVGHLAPALIKIDVEGHEEAVLRGAPKTLAHPGLLAIEAETVTDAAEAMLIANGFVRHYYDPLMRTLTTVPCALAASNRLYLRNPDAVRERVSTARRFDIFGWSV